MPAKMTEAGWPSEPAFLKISIGPWHHKAATRLPAKAQAAGAWPAPSGSPRRGHPKSSEGLGFRVYIGFRVSGSGFWV